MVKHPLAATAVAALFALGACSAGDADSDRPRVPESATDTHAGDDQEGITAVTGGRSRAAVDLRTVAERVEADMRTGDGYSTDAKDMARAIESATIDEDARVRSYGLSEESFQLCLVNEADGAWAYLDSTDDIIETGEGDSCP